MLGATPLLGRIFRPDEDAPGADPVVILSEGLWRSHFGGAMDVVGRTVLLNDHPATIVGVLPDRYVFLPSNIRDPRPARPADAGENLVVGAVGSARGLGLAWGLLELIVASPSMNLPRAQAIGLDGATLACAVALALVTPLVFGLVPAAHASRTDLRDLLAQAGRSGAGSLRARTRAALIVGEVALAVMLVTGATLLVRSFGRLIDVSPGFSTDQQFEVPLQLPVTHYATDAARDAFWRALVARAEALPGIQSAGITESLPLINDDVTSLRHPRRDAD